MPNAYPAQNITKQNQFRVQVGNITLRLLLQQMHAERIALFSHHHHRRNQHHPLQRELAGSYF